MLYKYTCQTCQLEIPNARVAFLLETNRQPNSCVDHSTEQAVIAFTAGDKGMTHVVVVKPEDEEKMEAAKLANKRSGQFS